MVWLDLIWSGANQTVAFLANLTTIVVGLFALIGAYRHAGDIRRLIAWLSHQEFANHVVSLRQILDKLNSLSYDNKESRPEVKSLLSELGGRLRPYLIDYPDLVEPYERLSKLNGPRLTESTKRGVVAEISTILDRTHHAESRRILEK